MKRESWIGQFARWATDWTGSTTAFLMALGVIAIWLLTGPIFNYNDTWQLVINTSTTIITFLMVFLIQRSQNKDSRAIHLKLNELVAAVHGASNRLLNVEDLSEEELKLLHSHYCHLVKLAKKDGSLTVSHSVEEAEDRHELKRSQTLSAKTDRHRSRGKSG
ncbi:Low affinity iron permease [Anatilimnocola aggregata]|uniref:Low affinity iron permease n=1 Tax=Anatilimnocola aggregata TaxID=2528021 RepID=A0A517YKK2_9BACT|nr:low affinity iron permease family protein [Anatilimnocola aggregata]QDU30750.1 Low affinity iron permease [Anatilimnocola aggregata]